VPVELPSFAEAALSDGRLLLEADRLVRDGLGDRRASFEIRLDALPRHVGFAVVCGMHAFEDRLGGDTVNPAAFDEAARLLGLGDATVARLRSPRFPIDVDAFPDGAIAFAGEAIATLEGPLFEVLLAATTSLTIVRRATRVATAAARLSIAADGDGLVEIASFEDAAREGAALIARAAYVGGFEATANPVASALVGIPLRATASRVLASLEGRTDAQSNDAGSWSSLPPELWTLLARGDDEGSLIELRRHGTRPTGWVAPTLALDEPIIVSDLVALEQGGAWRSHASSAHPGRKIVVRYFDASGRPLSDVIHFSEERIREPASVGAALFETLARPVLRLGRVAGGGEAPREARMRARLNRVKMPPEVLHLREPARYPVEATDAVRASRHRSLRPSKRAST
jgi:nicotinate phosphoribosyltransferase